MLLIIFLVIIRIGANSLSGVYQKKLSSVYSSLLINFISYFVLSLLCVLVFIFSYLFLGKNYFLINDNLVYYYALIIGLIGAIGNGFQIKALKKGELSILAPINAYKIVFSLIFSYFLLGEILNLQDSIGVCLIVIGSYYLVRTAGNNLNQGVLLRLDIVYRILAVFFTALEAIYIKKLILVSNSLTALFFWALFSSIFSLIFFSLSMNSNLKIKTSNNKQTIGYLIILSITMGLMQFSTNVLFKLMNVSIALCLFQLSSIVSVFLGYKFFREKNLLKKLIATTIMIIGACIIILNFND